MTLADESDPDAAETKVSSSSFYTALRILPRRERDAMFAIYDFCREVDDIADEPGFSTVERRSALVRWREDLRALYAGETRAAVQALEGPVRDFDLALEDFLAVVDGMEMDVDGPIQAPDFPTLDLYCDRVASAVGRLSVKVFGMKGDTGRDLAHHLGRALQFTNILRDLDEDADMDRLYLPREALAGAGIAPVSPAAVLSQPGLDRACRWLAAKAHDHYAEANRILRSGVSGRLRTPRLMSAVYGEILGAMEAEGWAAPRRRVSLSKRRLAWLLVRHGLA